MKKKIPSITGVYIFKGIKPGFLPGDLKIRTDEHGSTSLNATLSTSFNIVPTWLNISRGHLKNSKQFNSELLVCWEKKRDDASDLLSKEMESSLQAMMGCAIGLDALYAICKPFAQIEEQLYKQWRDNKTARAVYVSEVLRRLYKLDKVIFKQVRTNLKQIYDWRDRAVHPSVKLERALLREDLNVGIDWKFAVYRHKHAEIVYLATIGLILYLHHVKTGIEALDKEVGAIVDELISLGIARDKTKDEIDIT